LTNVKRAVSKQGRVPVKQAHKSNVVASPLPDSVMLGDFITIQEGVTVGEGTRISNYVNLYGCRIGKNCMIGAFVEIQRDAVVGDGSRISSHSFVCSLVEIGANCFIGHGVMFTNDLFPNGKISVDPATWLRTFVGDNVLIGSNATILPVRVGSGSVIAAGAVVTRDVPENSVIVGNPGRVTRRTRNDPSY
jgi:acetyltransferase-like isoleucine patch superfamily enzyme